MRVALIGYGKMGKAIERIALTQDVEIVGRFDEPFADSKALRDAEVAIEFSVPEAAVANIEACSRAGIPVVCGTTGWYDQLGAVSRAVNDNQTALVYGSNFAVGVALFRRLVAKAAAEFSSHSEYEAWAHEMHHSAKLDAPSGTLLTLVEDMRTAGYSDAVNISSARVGKVPGTHTIGFDSAADTITLTHTARNRDGFATGALHAARWIIGKSGVYEFADTL